MLISSRLAARGRMGEALRLPATSTPGVRWPGGRGSGGAPETSRTALDLIEQLMRQIMHYDAEFRREEATSAVGSHAKH